MDGLDLAEMAGALLDRFRGSDSSTNTGSPSSSNLPEKERGNKEFTVCPCGIYTRFSRCLCFKLDDDFDRRSAVDAEAERRRG